MKSSSIVPPANRRWASPSLRSTAAATPAPAADQLILVVASAKDARIVEVTELFLRLFGLGRADVVGRTLADLQLFGATNGSRKVRVRVAAGDVRELRVSSSTVRLGAESYVATNFDDVTEHVRAERVLRESAERFRCAFDRAVTGMAIIDTDRCWMRVNPALCQMLGRTEEELLDRPVAGFCVEGDPQLDGEELRRLLAREIEHVRIEKRFVHQAGHVVPAMLSGALVWSELDEPRYFVCQVQPLAPDARADPLLDDVETRPLTDDALTQR